MKQPVMTEQQRNTRIAQLKSEEYQQPLGWWYLSFAEDVFLGGCIVEAHGIITAIKRAHQLGIDPGGEVRSQKLDLERLPAEGYRNRLLTMAEVDLAYEESNRPTQ